MQLQLEDSTIEYLLAVIKQLTTVTNSEAPVSDEDLIEIINLATSRLNLSSRELASKFGVTPSTISRWKNGKNMPIPFVRKAIFTQIIKIANEQIIALRKPI